MEHRWGERVDLGAPARLYMPDGRSVDVTIHDASISGAFLETRLRPPLLSRVTVWPLARPDERHDACVVRSDHRGIGLEWLDPGSESLAPLLAIQAAGRHRMSATPSRRLPRRKSS